MINDNTYATIYDILFSLTKVEDRELIDLILSKLEFSDVLDVDERVVLKTFKDLYTELGSVPTSGTLVSRDITFSNANTILEESIEDITKLFILNKKKMQLSSILTNSSMDLVKAGVNTEEIIGNIEDALIKFNPKDVEDKIINTATDEIINVLINEEEVKGIPFGIDFVDSLYRGITPKSVNVIAGFTGSMKTTLAANLSYNAVSSGKNVLYISLEVDKRDMFINLVTRHTMSSGQTPIKREVVSKMRYENPDEFVKISKSFQDLPGKLLIISEEDINSYSDASFNEVIKNADSEFIKLNGNKTDIIVLDHMQLLKFSDDKRNADPYMIVNHFTSYFRRLAAKNDYGVVLLSQTSRGGYEYACKHDGQYQLTGLAESNELERGATFVLSLFSSDSLIASNEIQVQILKNRYGEKMLEPQTTSVKPEYYMIGNGLELNPQQVESVFNDDGTFTNPINTIDTEEMDLDSLLGM